MHLADVDAVPHAAADVETEADDVLTRQRHLLILRVLKVTSYRRSKPNMARVYKKPKKNRKQLLLMYILKYTIRKLFI